MNAPVMLRVGFKAALAVGVLGMVATAGGQTTGASSGQSSTQPTQQPARARVKLDGFDLSKAPPRAQIGGVSRGAGAMKLYAPDKALAYSLHPTLQWSGTQGIKYKVQIEDLADHSGLEATTVEGTSFTYPETAQPLQPGHTYKWSVQPETDMMGGTSDSALIVIAGGAERDAIASALAAITQTGEAGDRARAQVYFDKRVWYDAARAYSILIAAHPDDAELHRMRGSLYDQVPATEKLADQDFAMAK
jgi:Domain of Unknown Function (DUF928)